MTKAFAILKRILPNAIHLTCNAHIMNLVGETWRKLFTKADKLVASSKAMLTHSSARKQRYKDFMTAKTGDEAPLPPVPVLTRWNNWFQTVFHHSNYIDHITAFIQNELGVSDEIKALSNAQELLTDEELIGDVKFILTYAWQLVNMLTWFEAREIRIHMAYNCIHDLLSWAESEAEHVEASCQTLAFTDTVSKLKQYYAPRRNERFTQPGLQFMKSVHVVDVQQVKILNAPEDMLADIPQFANADNNYSHQVLAEFEAYKTAAQEISTDCFLAQFWVTNTERWLLLSARTAVLICAHQQR